MRKRLRRKILIVSHFIFKLFREKIPAIELKDIVDLPDENGQFADLGSGLHEAARLPDPGPGVPEPAVIATIPTHQKYLSILFK